jgi:hypothetical protein
MRRVANGTRIEENGWIRVAISGTPHQRGFANGLLVAKEMSEVIRMLRYLIPNSYGIKYEELVDIIYTLLSPQIQSNFPEYYEEMKGITSGAKSGGTKISFEEVVFWNTYYSVGYMIGHIGELIKNNSVLSVKYRKLAAHGLGSGAGEGGGSDRCTAFIAVGDYTADGKIVCAHNTFDNFMDAQYCNVMLSVKPAKGNAFIMQTAPGCIASGTDYYVNDRGMVITETTIGGFTKFKLADPICCRVRQAVQYGKTLDDYIEILKRNNSGDYANSWLIGDTKTNTIMRIELGLEYINVEKKKNGYFIGFNAPYDPAIRALECENTGFYDIRRHQGARRVRLTQLMEKHKGKINIEIGEEVLSDHYDVYLNKINMCSRTCCSHYNLDAREFMSQADRPLPYQPRGAMDGIVTDTTLVKQMGLVARWGSSCGTPFYAKEFCDRNLQWADQKPYLMDRISQPWTTFYLNERTGTHHHATKRTIKYKSGIKKKTRRK